MGKKSPPLSHWTKGLSGENATAKLGARFHIRKLFLRGEEFSQDELEYVIQCLINETTIQEQKWWAALAHFERLEIVSRLTLRHVAKGKSRSSGSPATRLQKPASWSMEAKPIDPSAAPVLRFLEGSVVGNLNLPQSVLPQQGGGGAEPSSLEALACSGSTNWRWVKRERQFRELQKIALDTLGFVLERIEAESNQAQSDQRLKIESVREVLRVKREYKLSELCAGLTSMMQIDAPVTSPTHPETSVHHRPSSPRTTSPIKSASWTEYAPAVSLSTRIASLPQVTRVLPSVVLQHAERIAQSRSEMRKKPKSTASSNTPISMTVPTASPATGLLCETEPGLPSAFIPELDQDRDASPSRMTRQQRRAARAFANLHSPVAAKSLGDDPFKIGRAAAGGDFEFAKGRD